MTLFTVTSILILVALSVAAVSGLVIDDAFALHDDDNGDLWVGHPTLNHTFIPTLDVATNEFTFAFDMRTQLFRAAKVSLNSPGSSEVIPLSDSKVRKHDGYARYTLTLPDETVYRVLSWDSPGSFQTAKGAALNYNYDPDHPHVGQYSRSASSSYDVISTNPITPVVSISSATGGGTGGNVTFTLQANPAPSFPLPVIINVTTVGEYDITTGRQVTPIHENGFGTISLLIDGTTHNGNGSVTIQINEGVGYTRGADVIKTVDVLDLQQTQQPTVPSTLSNSTQSTPIQQDAILLDTVPPVITITGKNPIIINLGTTYNDAGATCTDDIDTTPTLTDTNTVDTTTVGQYTVTYTCADSTGNNAVSQVRTVNVITVPNAPTLSTTPGNALVELFWTAPTNLGGSEIIGYIIQHKLSTDPWPGTSTTVGNILTSTITGLTNGLSYDFRINAINDAGTGASSNVAQVTPILPPTQQPDTQQPDTQQPDTQQPDTQQPDTAPPTIVIIGANPVTMSLGDIYNDAGATCTDDTDTNPTLVQRSTVDASSRGSYTVTYTCTDDSNNSAQAVRTVIVITVPSAPTGLTATTGNAQVVLSWRAPDNGGAAITDYTIQYSANAGTSWSTFDDGIGTGTTATVTGLTNGQSYQFRVSATNTVGTGSTSVTDSATPVAPVTDTTAPVITINGANSITITVGTTYTDAGATCTDDTDPNPLLTQTGTVDTFTVGQYTVTYRCTDDVNNSAIQHVRTVNVIRTPDVPTLSVTPDNAQAPVGQTTTTPDAPTYPSFWITDDATEVRLFWDVPASDGGSVITGYKSQYKISTDSAWTDRPTSLSIPATIPNLTPNQQYEFRVFAINNIGISEPSTVSSIILEPRQATTVPIPATEPSAPTNLQATVGNGQVSLSWTAPTNNGGAAITDYKVEYQTSGGSWQTFADGTSTTTSATVTGLTNGVQHSFRVLATNSVGDSQPSNVDTATPTASATVPDAPMYPSFWITDDATEVRLFWDVPASDGGSVITNYKPQYKIATTTSWTDGPTGLTIPAIITGLTPNEPYQFRVFAINDIGTSEPSTVSSIILEPRN